MPGYVALPKVSNFCWLQLAESVRVQPRHSSCWGNKLGLPVYRISDTVRSTHNQDGAIVLDIRQGQMFTINFVGSRILELLKNGSSESVIVDEISRGFSVSRELAENDVREFLQTLKTCHLVEEREPGVAV